MTTHLSSLLAFDCEFSIQTCCGVRKHFQFKWHSPAQLETYLTNVLPIQILCNSTKPMEYTSLQFKIRHSMNGILPSDHSSVFLPPT